MDVNIGRFGRLFRAATGTLCVLGGAACLVVGWPEPVAWRWCVGLLLILAGLFQWFEAGKGWCAIRACGIKTPM